MTFCASITQAIVGPGEDDSWATSTKELHGTLHELLLTVGEVTTTEVKDEARVAAQHDGASAQIFTGHMTMNVLPHGQITHQANGRLESMSATPTLRDIRAMSTPCRGCAVAGVARTGTGCHGLARGSAMAPACARRGVRMSPMRRKFPRRHQPQAVCHSRSSPHYGRRSSGVAMPHTSALTDAGGSR
ncbi:MULTISPECIES: hypothetical protein [unclassified Streptomyces]|uniref:hypothetical protein n=1 Tax=unclassified Streptomyces TaxID=2593676 RepID=UPI001319E158|nr:MULTISPECIES: hypothetical protein [unclassified Streptomyces]MYX32810.1 hypothetical protein [Streptomyces sp. SID8377]